MIMGRYVCLIALLILPAEFVPDAAPRITTVHDQKVGLLDYPRVQEELKLTPEQVRRVKEISARARERSERASEQFVKERATTSEGIKSAEKEIAATYSKELAATLNSGQMKRVREVTLHLRGAGIFLDPSIRNQLEMTEAQEADVSRIVAHHLGRAGALLPDVMDQAARQATKRQREAIKKEMEADILKLLDAKQLQALKEMRGEPPPTLEP